MLCLYNYINIHLYIIQCASEYNFYIIFNVSNKVDGINPNYMNREKCLKTISQELRTVVKTTGKLHRKTRIHTMHCIYLYKM